MCPANILEQTKKVFPCVYVTPSTLHSLKEKQLHYQAMVKKLKVSQPAPSVLKKIKTLQQQQKYILQILQKDLKHSKYLQECKNSRHLGIQVRKTLQNKRETEARAHRYFQDYELDLKSKLQRPRTKEELTFIKTFDHNLDLQKQMLRRTVKQRSEMLHQKEQQICKELETINDQYPHN